MTLRLPPLAWLRAFEATARTGSFAAAAEELALTQPAVSYQVRSLEGHLGYTLFERRPRSLKITETGTAYLAPVARALYDLSTATAGLFGPTSGARLHIKAPVSFGTLWLAPRLHRFHAACPQIELRLSSSVLGDAVPAERLDLEVRFGDGRWPEVSAERLFQDHSVPLSRPDPAGPAERAGTMADLEGATLISIVGIEGAWGRLFQRLGGSPPRQTRQLTVDSSLMALELAASGYGHAFVLRSLAANYIAKGRLRNDLGVTLPHALGHFVVERQGASRRSPEAALFRDWLLEESRRFEAQAPAAEPYAI